MGPLGAMFAEGVFGAVGDWLTLRHKSDKLAGEGIRTCCSVPW